MDVVMRTTRDGRPRRSRGAEAGADHGRDPSAGEEEDAPLRQIPDAREGVGGIASRRAIACFWDYATNETIDMVSVSHRVGWPRQIEDDTRKSTCG
jgi:hypothetical protein